MQKKTKRIINIIVDVVVFILLILTVVLTVNTLTQSKQGYVEIFGHANVIVLSDSMKGGYKDSEYLVIPNEKVEFKNGFQENDMLKVKLTKTVADKTSLEVGDIITYWDIIGAKRVLNSHRIVRVKYLDDDSTKQVLGYQTKGDANSKADEREVENVDGKGDVFYYMEAKNVVGKVVKVTKGGGKFTRWTQEPVGSFICIVFPSLIVVFYCAYLVVKTVMDEKRKKNYVSTKDKIKLELMKELGIDKPVETNSDSLIVDKDSDVQNEKSVDGSIEVANNQETVISEREKMRLEILKELGIDPLKDSKKKTKRNDTQKSSDDERAFKQKKENKFKSGLVGFMRKLKPKKEKRDDDPT